MKKALVVLLSLAMVFSAFAGAPEVKMDSVSLTGSSTITWGITFDGTKTGFTNVNDASATIVVSSEGTASKSGDATVYGEIEVKAGEIVVKAGEAKNGFPTASLEKAVLHVGPAAIDITGYKVEVAGAKAASAGFTVGYGIDGIADLKVAFGSTGAETSKYALGVAADIKAVDGLTAKAGFDLLLADGSPVWNVDGTAGYAIAGADVSVYVSKKSVEDFITIKPTVAYAWGDKIKVDGIEQKAGIVATTTIKTNALGAIGLNVKAIDNTFVENMNWALTVDFSNLADFDTNVTKITAYADFNLADISTKVNGKVEVTLANATAALKLKAGADYTGFANTTVSANLETNDLLSGATLANKLGKLTTSVKIAL